MRKKRETPVHGGCCDPRITGFQSATAAFGLDAKPRPDPRELVIVRNNQEPTQKCIELVAPSLTPAASDGKLPDFGNGLKAQGKSVVDQVGFIQRPDGPSRSMRHKQARHRCVEQNDSHC